MKKTIIFILMALAAFFVWKHFQKSKKEKKQKEERSNKNFLFTGLPNGLREKLKELAEKEKGGESVSENPQSTETPAVQVVHKTEAKVGESTEVSSESISKNMAAKIDEIDDSAKPIVPVMDVTRFQIKPDSTPEPRFNHRKIQLPKEIDLIAVLSDLRQEKDELILENEELLRKQMQEYDAFSDTQSKEYSLYRRVIKENEVRIEEITVQINNILKNT